MNDTDFVIFYLKLFWVDVSGASYQPQTHHSFSVLGLKVGNYPLKTVSAHKLPVNLINVAAF